MGLYLENKRIKEVMVDVFEPRENDEIKKKYISKKDAVSNAVSND